MEQGRKGGNFAPLSQRFLRENPKLHFGGNAHAPFYCRDVSMHSVVRIYCFGKFTAAFLPCT